MSLFLVLLAKLLTANGVPATVCGGDLVIGESCPTTAAPPPPASPPPASPPASPPPASPPPPSTARPPGWPQRLDPLSISNGI